MLESNQINFYRRSTVLSENIDVLKNWFTQSVKTVKTRAAGKAKK